MRGLAGPLSRATVLGLLALSGLLIVTGPGASGATRAGTSTEVCCSWTVYHGDAAGSGVSNSASAVVTSVLSVAPNTSVL